MSLKHHALCRAVGMPTLLMGKVIASREVQIEIAYYNWQ